MENVLWAITLDPHIFFPTIPNDMKKITHQLNHDDMYPWGKNQISWSTFEHSNFIICTKYNLIKHVSSILSTMAFSH